MPGGRTIPIGQPATSGPLSAGRSLRMSAWTAAAPVYHSGAVQT